MQFIEPRGPGIRVDSGFAAGSEVTHFYDPLLAKLIVHGENREVATQRMQAALKDFVVHGVITNIDFLQSVLAHKDFADGNVTTRWVETKFNWQPSEPTSEALIAAVFAEQAVPNRKTENASSNESDPFSPWKNPSGFRN